MPGVLSRWTKFRSSESCAIDFVEEGVSCQLVNCDIEKCDKSFSGTTYVVEGAANFTLLIKNYIEFQKFGVKRCANFTRMVGGIECPFRA